MDQVEEIAAQTRTQRHCAVTPQMDSDPPEATFANLSMAEAATSIHGHADPQCTQRDYASMAAPDGWHASDRPVWGRLHCDMQVTRDGGATWANVRQNALRVPAHRD